MRSNLGLATILAGVVTLSPTTALSAEDLTIASFSAGSAECEDYHADVAASHGGSFLLVWSRQCGPPILHLVARLYDAEARPIGPEIDLGPGYSPSLVALPGGGYALAWVHSLSPKDQELYLARLDARGRRLGAPFVVDDGAPDPSLKSNARLAVDRTGRLALLWFRSQQTPYRSDFLLRRFAADLSSPSEVTSLAGGQNFKLKEDPRITKFGKFLRVTSLDEFPQFINVLKGEMSVVGPRPLVPDEIEKYGEAIEQVLSIRPGITGLWQVSGRNDIPYAQRIRIDVSYVKLRNFWLDLSIVLRTVRVMVMPRNNGAY